jgi:AraC-like DNA-binding protein/mannose-6-phosphate isomerase-like protein (cupin superfamily)
VQTEKLAVSDSVAPEAYGNAEQNHQFGCLEETLPLIADTAVAIWLHQGNHYDHPRHRHRALEMNLVVAGRGRYEVNGCHHVLGTGSILWIPSGAAHYLEERSSDFSMWIVAAERDLFGSSNPSDFAESMFQGYSEAAPAKVLPEQETNWLDRELARIQGSQSNVLLRAGLTYTLLRAWEATRAAPPIPPGKLLSAPLHRALALLEADARLSREDLAERVCITPERLGRLFQSELGIGFIEHRNRIRLQRFLDIHRSGRMTLLGACLEAGFGSYAQFHRVFTEILGDAPSRSLAKRPGIAPVRARSPGLEPSLTGV